MLQRIIHTPWSVARWLRFSIGLLMIYAGITGADYFAGTLGVIFAGQALLNMGCCSASGCYPDNSRAHYENTQDVSFEEIKTK